MDPLKTSAADLDWKNISFLLFVHVAAVTGTILYLTLHGATIAAVTILAFWLLACGFSVTAGYHRLFAHGSYQAHPLLRTALLLFGAAAFENSALKWATDHRRHHRFVDQEQDPYNIRKGFWWAHIGWVLRKEPPSPPAVPGDLDRDPLVRLQHRFYIPIAILFGFALPTLAGFLLGDVWGGLILGGFLRLVVLYHCTFCVNSLAHTLGSQPYSDASSARDSSLTAIITFGEGYHNFHHTFPFDYRNGVRATQIDPTKWLIRSWSWIGLARGLVQTSYDAILRMRLQMQKRRAEEKLKHQPDASALLQKRLDRLEHLLERWAALKQECADLRSRSGDRSRDMMKALRGRIREAQIQFRQDYHSWRRLVRRPAQLQTNP